MSLMTTSALTEFLLLQQQIKAKWHLKQTIASETFCDVNEQNAFDAEISMA